MAYAKMDRIIANREKKTDFLLSHNHIKIMTKIPRANKSDVAETRAREPRGPVERICRSGNIRPGGYIGALRVWKKFAVPFRPPLPWAQGPLWLRYKL